MPAFQGKVQHIPEDEFNSLRSIPKRTSLQDDFSSNLDILKSQDSTLEEKTDAITFMAQLGDRGRLTPSQYLDTVDALCRNLDGFGWPSCSNNQEKVDFINFSLRFISMGFRSSSSPIILDDKIVDALFKYMDTMTHFQDEAAKNAFGSDRNYYGGHSSIYGLAQGASSQLWNYIIYSQVPAEYANQYAERFIPMMGKDADIRHKIISLFSNGILPCYQLVMDEMKKLFQKPISIHDGEDLIKLLQSFKGPNFEKYFDKDSFSFFARQMASNTYYNPQPHPPGENPYYNGSNIETPYAPETAYRWFLKICSNYVNLPEMQNMPIELLNNYNKMPEGFHKDFMADCFAAWCFSNTDFFNLPEISSIFGFSKDTADKIISESPDWAWKFGDMFDWLRVQTERFDQLALFKLASSHPGEPIVKTIFEDTNVTSFSKYPTKILEHLYFDRNEKSDKPLYLIMQGKRSTEVFWNFWLKPDEYLAKFDMRVAEPNYKERIPEYAGKICRQVGKRVNIMHWEMHGRLDQYEDGTNNPNLVLKPGDLSPFSDREIIGLKDNAVIEALLPFSIPGHTDFILDSCSGAAPIPLNIATFLAEGLKCRVFASTNDYYGLTSAKYRRNGKLYEVADVILKRGKLVIIDRREIGVDSSQSIAEGMSISKPYPNPAANEIHFYVAGSHDPKTMNGTIEFTDVAGRVLGQLAVQNLVTGFTANISEFPSGAYFYSAKYFGENGETLPFQNGSGMFIKVK